MDTTKDLSMAPNRAESPGPAPRAVAYFTSLLAAELRLEIYKLLWNDDLFATRQDY
jgi:hypothetical protein